MTTDLLELAEKVAALKSFDNSIDVQVEIALFVPDDDVVSVRANSAGSKVIYKSSNGREATFWAQDWTGRNQRAATVATLRARAAA